MFSNSNFRARKCNSISTATSRLLLRLSGGQHKACTSYSSMLFGCRSVPPFLRVTPHQVSFLPNVAIGATRIICGNHVLCEQVRDRQDVDSSVATAISTRRTPAVRRLAPVLLVAAALVGCVIPTLSRRRRVLPRRRRLSAIWRLLLTVVRWIVMTALPITTIPLLSMRRSSRWRGRITMARLRLRRWGIRMCVRHATGASRGHRRCTGAAVLVICRRSRRARAAAWRVVCRCLAGVAPS